MSDGYFLDDNLKANLDLIKNKVFEDWDMCFVIDGIEGGGKSTFAMQIAKYLDPEFGVDGICFTPEDFMQKIKDPKLLHPGNALILDEGFIINARASMTQMNRKFLNMLSQCRQKNLFLFIILPTFFDLDRTPALWRSRALLHVYHHKMERGYFSFYSYEKKIQLYVKGKKFYSYKVEHPDFHGQFTSFKPLHQDGEAEYRRRKAEAFRKSEDNENKKVKDKMFMRQRDALIRFMWNKLEMTREQILNILPVDIRPTKEAISYIYNKKDDVYEDLKVKMTDEVKKIEEEMEEKGEEVVGEDG